MQSERQYWDARYGAGGVSGEGSVGSLRDWKWSVIEAHSGKLDDVVDVGCGDRSFWEGRDCPVYTGIDISRVIIERHRRHSVGMRFLCAPAGEKLQGIRGRVVLCMDVLFHVVDEGEYRRALRNLAAYTREWLFVFTWAENPFSDWRHRGRLLARGDLGGLFLSLSGRLETEGGYQRYRDFEDYVPLLRSQGLERVAIERNPSANRWGAMWIFKRHGD